MSPSSDVCSVALGVWRQGRGPKENGEAEPTSRRVAVGAGMTLRQRLTKFSINGQTKYFWLFGPLFSTEAAAHKQPDPGEVGVASLAKGPSLLIQGFLVQAGGSWAPGGPALSLPFRRLPPTCWAHRKQSPREQLTLWVTSSPLPPTRCRG